MVPLPRLARIALTALASPRPTKLPGPPQQARQPEPGTLSSKIV
jgi:hypothetical protein